MADYPNSKLDKALALRAASSTSRASWQEWMERHSTVPGIAIQAPEVLQGFSGSWAAQYGLDDGVKDTSVPRSPAQTQRQVNHLGLPGMAEIAFRPYDWGTTRHGKYGPSLLGHPVSFEVVGPTAKSPQLYHQWVLDTSGAQDILTIDAITWRSTVAVPEALFATLDEIPEIYGIATIPEEGLYLVVSLTGHKGYLDDVGGGVPGVGGLGDGTIGQQADGLDPRTAISTPSNGVGQKAKFEVFRVEDMDATSITLAAGKRIADYFTVPGGTAIIRAVTLIKPAAARLVAVPGSGEKGKEQVFAFVPPEKALTSDLLPPSALWTLGFCDPWLNYNASASTGAAGDYDQKNALPIPKPVRQGTGRLQAIFGEAPVALSTGGLQVMLDTAASFSTADAGKIIRIYSVTRYQDGNWSSATVDGGNRVGDPELDRLLGYWVIDLATAGAPNSYNLRMVSQVDPLTGVPFPGSSEFMHMAQGDLAAGKEVRLQWTLHDAVSTLWTDRHLQPDKLDSARLRGLIDPSWVKPSSKNIDLADTEASPARPDRASFGTVTGEDPGSLLDLGFRPVFYPAKVSVTDPTTLVPDFENPITSNELMLDPTLTTEKQFLEVDYSAGLVSLSHPPIAGTGCQLAPDSLALLNASNPRREMTFFASFVPFSQEPGQRGVVPRVTGGQYLTAPGSACEDAVESQDVYGSRLHWPLASGQTITSGTAFQIKLDVQLNAIDLPPTGFIEVVYGADVPLGTPGWVDGSDRRISTFGYTSVIYIDAGNGNNTTLEGCFGGGVNGVAITTSALATRLTAVLRRDVVSPNRGDGSTGTDFQSDTTYGSSKRGTALRFKRATTSMEPDGSLTVDTRDPLTVDHQALFQDLFSSWVLSGGVMGTALPAAGATLSFTELVVLIGGLRQIIPAQDVTVAAAPNKYVYIDGSSPSCPVYAFTNTMNTVAASGANVLLGEYSFAGPNVSTYVDLRQPMLDIDKRLDVTVGAYTGHDQPADAHFSTLADAVNFVQRTMVPTTGNSGRYRRIKVIGPTTEDEANLPITLSVAGLVIEGNANQASTINWTGNSPLFELTTCNRLVIRDLTFKYTEGVTPASSLPQERCLFSVKGNAPGDVVFDNIHGGGLMHGFFYVWDVGGGYDQVTFRNCVAESLTDYALRVEPSATGGVERLLVDHCYFKAGTKNGLVNPECTALVDPAVVYLMGVSGTTAVGGVIQNSYIEGGVHGFYLGNKFLTVTKTRVYGTDHSAVVVGNSNVKIDGCYFSNIHVTPIGGLVGPTSAFVGLDRGIYILSSGDYSSVHNCYVDIGFVFVAATDRAIYTDPSASGVLIRGNRFNSHVEVEGTVLFESNYCLYGSYFTSPDSTFAKNTLGDTTRVADFVCSGHNQRFHNNTFLSDGTGALVWGGTDGAADRAIQEYVGNHISCPVTDQGVDTQGLRNSQITGNHFVYDVTFFGAPAVTTPNLKDCVISGNEFDLDYTQTIGTDNTYTGNRFRKLFLTTANQIKTVVQGNKTGLTLSVSGSVDATVTGNHSLVDFNASNSTRCLLQGNRSGGDLTLTGADDYICIGNHVVGNILIDAGAAQTNCGVVIGNRSQSIDDGAAGAAPTNYQVTLGNKVDNGLGGTVYGAGPPIASVVASNIKDDV